MKPLPHRRAARTHCANASGTGSIDKCVCTQRNAPASSLSTILARPERTYSRCVARFTATQVQPVELEPLLEHILGFCCFTGEGAGENHTGYRTCATTFSANNSKNDVRQAWELFPNWGTTMPNWSCSLIVSIMRFRNLSLGHPGR